MRNLKQQNNLPPDLLNQNGFRAFVVSSEEYSLKGYRNYHFQSRLPD